MARMTADGKHRLMEPGSEAGLLGPPLPPPTETEASDTDQEGKEDEEEITTSILDTCQTISVDRMCERRQT